MYIYIYLYMCIYIYSCVCVCVYRECLSIILTIVFTVLLPLNLQL